MNIDVREYLRINPISVHELTLSDDDNDCFLFFPTSPSTRGYTALKQSDLFTELKKSIFGGLLDYSQDPPKIRTSGVTEDDITGKFKNYVRRSVARTFMDDFDGKLNTLENGLDSIILALRRKGILDYAGAVELQSNNTRKLTWKLNSSDTNIFGPIYRNMSYSLGQIWCKTTDSNKATTGGLDDVSIGSLPLQHKHPDTMAETLTGPLSDKFGGGQLMGDFTIGSKELVAQGTKYGPSTGGKATPLEHATNEALTYPLWGQNILDWRNPKKEHNNVPPSLNIYVRYWAANQSSIRGLVESPETYEEIIKRIAEIRGESAEDGKKKDSAAESRYDSAMVCELPNYVEENLTPHDYILRIAYDGKQQIQLWRQGLQMLLDIFSDKTNKELSTEDGSMKELLMKLLDGLLMTVSEFMQWYDQASKRLDAIEKKIEIAEQLCKSVPPLNYIGRIIISYTDDTEQKVIANYGGKSWRRIENFLRGVNEDNPEDIPGQKVGEEFVALRESNIPIHSHTETLPSEESQITTQQQEWMAKNKGGDAKIVNTTLASSDTRNSVQIENTNRNYQISPLEYPSKGENEITLPHDNLPPYMKMYIWECVELTDEEYAITKEPEDDLRVITWLSNEGTWSGTVSSPDNANRRLWTCKIGQKIKNYPTSSGTRTAPTVSKTGYDFIGWKCPDGTIKPSASSNPNIPAVIDDVAMGNAYYVAQWKPTTHILKFSCNEHTAKYNCTSTNCGLGASDTIFQRTYNHGDEIGFLPIPDELPEMVTGFDGWYTDHRPNQGSKIDESWKVINDNVTYYAHWNKPEVPEYIIRFYKENETDPYIIWDGESGRHPKIRQGARLGELPPNPTRAGYTFKGWFTARTDGDQVFSTQRVYNNLNLYEQWIADTCTITWNPNYPGCETFTSQREYGSEVGTLPIANRTGYDQKGWWTASSGGSQILASRPVNGSETYYAHWNEPTEYHITYNLNGGNWGSQTYKQSYTVEDPDFTLKTPAYAGRTFLGWTGSNGNTPQLTVTIEKGSTGDKRYVANWNIGNYTVLFAKNNNRATGEMSPQQFTRDAYQKLNQNNFQQSVVVSFNGNGGTAERGSLTSYREFVGWATSESGGKVYNDQQNVMNIAPSGTNQITLYGVWGINDNGSPRFSNIYLPNANRTGYTFANWYTSGGSDMGGKGTAYQPTANITLYAHWTANNYIVTFDPTSGSVTQQTKPVTYGQAYGTLPTPTHDDYAFTGWFTLSEGGSEVKSNTIMTTPSNHTLYAHWKDGKMTLTFNANLGYFEDEVPQTRSCWIGKAFSFSQNTPPGEFPSPVRPGYQFSGWYSDDETFEREVVSSDNAPEEDMEIFARWTPNFYIIRFNANGGSGAMADQIVQYGTRDQLKTNQFTYDGGRFDGWALSPSGNVRWEDNDTIINLSENLGDVINVYAIWYSDPIRVTFNSNWDQYTMTFNANGGVGGWSKRLDAGTQITTPTVTRENYDFIGWSPIPPTTMPANDVTCTAQWRQQAITAKITTSGNRATCSEVNPPDATVQYSISNATSGYNNGSTFTLTFTSGATQTKSGWFKISKAGLTDAIYKVSITQTVSKDWSAWVAATGLSGNDVATALARLKSLYGEGNFELDVQKISDHHYSARERHVIGTQTSYSSTTEKIS